MNVLYGTEYTDLCYGYNAFWRRLVPLFDVDGTGFEVETLMALSVAKAGAAVTQITSYERSRVSGASNLNTFRDGWRVLRMILRERCRPGYRARGGDHLAIPATLAIEGMNDESATDDLFEDLRT